MTRLLLGAPVKEQIKNNLLERVKGLNIKPALTIVQVGDRPDSNLYIKNKIKFGEEIGIKVVLEKFDESIEEDELREKVREIAEDKNVNGIIVQLPLPSKINSNKIIEAINKEKDADGLSSVSDFSESNLVTPATARAVLAMLNFYNIEVANKKVAVIGRSKLAGGPIAETLKSLGALVTVCHRGTENIKEVCLESDLIISAAGQIGLVGKEFVKPGQVIIDVGINKNTLGKLVGDVNFAEVAPIVDSITPVPGGVGPLIVACLFENLLDLIEKKS